MSEFSNTNPAEEGGIDKADPAGELTQLTAAVEDLQVRPDRVTRITKHLLTDVSFRDPQLGVPSSIQDALILDLGKECCSQIQLLAIPAINSGKNIKAQAQSGSGKTIAFCTGALNRIDPALKQVQAIIAAPYRELVEQIADELKKLVKRTPDITIQKLVFGEDVQTDSEPQCRSQVVVGTPAMISKYSAPRPRDRKPTAFFKLSNVKIFVVDEADDQVAARNTARAGAARQEANHLMELLKPPKLPAVCQVCMFSATYPPESDGLCEAALNRTSDQYMSIALKKEQLKLEEILQVSINVAHLNPDKVRELRVGVDDAEKRKLCVLKELLEDISMEKCVIFATRRVDAMHIQDLCKQLTPPIHIETLVGGKENEPGYMSPAERTRVSEKFRNDDSCRFLVATNLIARGFDVPEVSTVINYELPIDYNSDRRAAPKGDSETYIHRVGRTGRFGVKGVAINLLNGEGDERLMREIAHEAYVTDAAGGGPVAGSGDLVKQFDPNNISDLVAQINAFTGRS